jgi:pyrroline-5-carboxylate reductase
MQVIVASIALKAVVEVAERRIAAEQLVISVAAGCGTTAIASRQRHGVIPGFAEQVVEAARAIVEELIPAASPRS